MNALNYLPLPVVKLLAFFHEELSEQRPGRFTQIAQLWVGCLLVVLISMTFEIPFLAISLAVLFYGVQSNVFYTKFVAILFVVATVLEIGSLFLIYKWSYSYPLMRMIIASVIVLVCMFMMRTHRLGLLFFRCSYRRRIRANLPRYARLSGGSGSSHAVVYRCWALPNAADGTDRRTVVPQSRGNANAARLVRPARRCR
nr:multidrug efflux system protein MdtO [Salmonella sp. NCTC 7297]